MSKGVKIFAIVVGLISVAILGFSYIGNKTAVPDTSGLSSTSGTATGTASDITPASTNTFIQLLSTTDNITLDTSIFQNAGYKALRDYPVALGTAVVGRNNPFAPIGTDAATSGTALAPLQVQTLAPAKITATTAEFGALVTNAGAAPTSVVFQYGTSDTFGSSTTPVNVTATGTALFSATRLTPGTTYYVEAVAVQGSTTATGTIMTFTTAAQQKR